MSKLSQFSQLILQISSLTVFFCIFVATFIHEFFTSSSKNLKKYENQVIMITGTGSGLGRELAKKFAKLGSQIALIDVNEASNCETFKQVQKISNNFLKTYTCDISKRDQVKQLALEISNDFGKIDVLISNAAILACHKITEGSDIDIQRVFDVNLLSNFWIVREFLKLVKINNGHFVFINSESGIHGLGLASSYAASKAGLLGLAYSLKNELGKNRDTKDIKITSVHPRFFASHSSMKKAIEVKTGWLDIESVADKIIDGIRNEFFTFCVPGDFLLSTLFRQLPIGFYNFLVDKYFATIRAETRPVFQFFQRQVPVVIGVSSQPETFCE